MSEVPMNITNYLVNIASVRHAGQLDCDRGSEDRGGVELDRGRVFLEGLHLPGTTEPYRGTSLIRKRRDARTPGFRWPQILGCSWPIFYNRRL